MATFNRLVALFVLLSVAKAQTGVVTYVSQSSTFNSSFLLSPQQISTARLDAQGTNNVEISLNYERSQLAGGRVTDDPFYAVPPSIPFNGADTPVLNLPPGTLIKTEEHTDTSLYSLASNLALSRILYTTTTLNNTIVPASAAVLWPFTPRKFANCKGAPVVVWAHGTSGYFADGAPSKIRNLWYDYVVPFTLALQGYAVVMPDYAGLGVGSDAPGHPVHQYLAGMAGANDVVNAFLAAQQAWPEQLSREWVTMGHSQGGGVAWAVAQREVNTPTEGYLGAIAGSPVTDLFGGGGTAAENVAAVIANWVSSYFPSFELSDWLTPVGIGRLDVLRQVQGGVGTFLAISAVLDRGNAPVFVKDGWNETWYYDQLRENTDIDRDGGQRHRGPLLVLQGTADPLVSYNVTSRVVSDTCRKFPESQLDYVVGNGTMHVPTLDATQMVWLDWIKERFEGKPVAKGCKREEVFSFRPFGEYQLTRTSYEQWAGAPQYAYEVFLGS